MSRTTAVLLLIAAAGTWGATFPVVKGALTDTGPLTFLALRFTVAAALLLPVLRAGGSFRSGSLRAVACGAALFTGYTLQTTGLTTTTPARSAFITALSVVLVPVLEWCFRMSQATWRVWTGAGLALAGLGVLLQPESRPVSAGDLLTFGCAVAFAFHVLLLQWAVRAMPAARASTLQVLTTAGLAVPAAAVEWWKFTVTPRLVVAVLVCAVVATVFAFWVMTAVQRVLSAALTAVVLAFEPVAAAATSVVLGQDAPTLAMVAGGLVVVGGVIFATVAPRHEA